VTPYPRNLHEIRFLSLKFTCNSVSSLIHVPFGLKPQPILIGAGSLWMPVFGFDLGCSKSCNILGLTDLKRAKTNQ
jgi:hypothetical protein